MTFLERLFCSHDNETIENNYAMLGYEKCIKCGKEIYTGVNCEFTNFKIGKLNIK